MGHVLERSDRGGVHRAMRGRSSQSTCFYAFRIDSSSAFRCNMLPGVQLCSTYPFLIAAHIHTLICFWVSEVLTFVLRTFSFMEGSALFPVAHAENATLLIPPSFRFYSQKKVSACSARKFFRVIWSGNEKKSHALAHWLPAPGVISYTLERWHGNHEMESQRESATRFCGRQAYGRELASSVVVVSLDTSLERGWIFRHG